MDTNNTNTQPTPPPYEGADRAPEATPMYGSTASNAADAPAATPVDSALLANIRPGFWD